MYVNVSVCECVWVDVCVSVRVCVKSFYSRILSHDAIEYPAGFTIWYNFVSAELKDKQKVFTITKN